MTSEEKRWIEALRKFLPHVRTEAPHAVEAFRLFLNLVEDLVADPDQASRELLEMKYRQAHHLESVLGGMGPFQDFQWSRKAGQDKETLERALRDVLRAYWKALGNPAHDPADFPEIPPGAEVRLIEGRTLFLGRDGMVLPVSRAAAARQWTVLETQAPDISGMPLLLLASENLRQLARQEAVEPLASTNAMGSGKETAAPAKKARQPRATSPWRIPLSEARPLMVIPGIGRSMAEDLHDLGFRRVADLRDRDPQEMYDRLRSMRGGTMDRCVLYAFRCAVYFASHEEHDPELLKWWRWKDRD